MLFLFCFECSLLGALEMVDNQYFTAGSIRKTGHTLHKTGYSIHKTGRKDPYNGINYPQNGIDPPQVSIKRDHSAPPPKKTPELSIKIGLFVGTGTTGAKHAPSPFWSSSIHKTGRFLPDRASGINKKPLEEAPSSPTLHKTGRAYRCFWVRCGTGICYRGCFGCKRSVKREIIFNGQRSKTVNPLDSSGVLPSFMSSFAHCNPEQTMQLVKKRDIRDKNVAKAQPLVEAAYNFSLWEKRVYTIMASLVGKDDPDFKSYRINIRDIIEFYECKSHDAYERIREVPESLLTKNKIIQIPYTTEDGHKRVLKTHLITAITAPLEGDKSEGNGYIELEFHPRLKPFLLGLKRYLCYDIKNTIGISSVHSLRIFEFLKLHQYKGKHETTVHDLKVMLGVEHKHKKYGHFKRVIVKAQKDLKKHTDITFEFEEIKKGRAVHALLFFIFPNEDNIDTTPDTKPLPTTRRKPTALGDGESLYQWVQDWGVTRETFRGFLDQYSLAHIKERIEYIQRLPKKRNIRNKGAYLRTMLEQPSLFVATPKAAPPSAPKKDTAPKQAAAKVQLVALRKRLHEEENAHIDALFAREPETLRTMIEHTKASRLGKGAFDPARSDADNFTHNQDFRLFVYSEAKKRFPELLKPVQEPYKAQIEALKRLAR